MIDKVLYPFRWLNCLLGCFQLGPGYVARFLGLPDFIGE